MCSLMVCNITGGYELHQQNTNQSPTSNGSSERGGEDVDLGFMQLGQSLWYRNLLDFPPLICLYTCTGASLWNKHDPYPPLYYSCLFLSSTGLCAVEIWPFCIHARRCL